MRHTEPAGHPAFPAGAPVPTEPPEHPVARAAIHHLLTDGTPDQLDPAADYGGWAEIVHGLSEAHERGGTDAVKQLFQGFAKVHPPLLKLLETHDPQPMLELELRFRTLNPDQIADLPAPIFLIKDTIVLGETTVIAGPGDSGKTFLVTDMCWKAAQHYPVCYIAAEDALGISLRMHAWSQHHQHPYPEHFRLLATGAGVPCAVELMDDTQIDALIALIQAEGIKLLVIDTLSQCSGGADENGSDMARLAAACNRIAHATGAAVVVIHHSTKDGKHYRGHSTLKDNTYGFFSVSKEDDIICLAKVRIKNTGTIADRHFRLVTVDLGRTDSYGDPITSAVALPAHKVRSTSDDLTPSRREVLSQIALIQDADEAPKSGQLKQSLRHMNERTFYRALKWLRENHYVRLTILGSRYQVTDAGRTKLGQAGETPTEPALLDEEYFLVNPALTMTRPERIWPGASYAPADSRPTTDTSPVMTDVTGDTATPDHIHTPHSNGQNGALPLAPPAAIRTDTAGVSVSPADTAETPDTDTICDTDTDTSATTIVHVPMHYTTNTAPHCHDTDTSAMTPADPDLTDLPPVSTDRWQSVPGQSGDATQDQETDHRVAHAPEPTATHRAAHPDEHPPGHQPHPVLAKAEERLKQAALLLKQGESDATVRTILNGLTGWLKRIVRSGIDRMIQAHHSGETSIDEALRLSLDKLHAGGVP